MSEIEKPEDQNTTSTSGTGKNLVEEFNKKYSLYHNTYKNYVNFIWPDYLRHKTYAKCFRVELQITCKNDNEPYEVFVGKAPSVKEARKKAQIEFLNKTFLLNPKQLPKNEINRKYLIRNLIDKKEKPSSGFLRDNSDNADFTFFLKSKQTRKIETTSEKWTVDRAEKFQFFKEEDKEVLKIYTYWTKHEILDGMPKYYYSDSWQPVRNFIGGGEETLENAYMKLNNGIFKDKVRISLKKIGFKKLK